ncbi:helix-turn-helix transcriptional regulator [Nonomuraea endophytica]|uniref:Transcriptional regulator with XRE-family HTH domain n=1 Tax=Nonomuraea endophytica TaxID=714136 RepID=A0A7W7ZYF6_9ACTN|nr:helix-turn-helix transcriptional regulator [Nonomuraea endophytica]MBB5075754.1 transcriptional regulator with XRE-family HTH domain [Nonomuraea endophytica]
MANDLGEFLRSRRARVRPSEAGLPTYGERRRVAGLRREEVALLAGVSVPYYVRLEQGRAGNVSAEVLNAIARVLGLDDTERAHLHDLARLMSGKVSGKAVKAPVDRVRPTVRRVLDAMSDIPAFVMGRRTDMLACNRLASLLFWNRPTPPDGPLNCARLVFLEEQTRSLFRDWEHKARETVAFLRLDAGRHPNDRALAALVGELSVKSADFRGLWAEHEVQERSAGRNILDHPLVGELVLDYESLRPGEQGDQVLVTYLAEPGSRTEEALRFLASWHAVEIVRDV